MTGPVTGKVPGPNGQPTTATPSAPAPQVFVVRKAHVDGSGSHLRRSEPNQSVPVLLSAWADLAFETSEQKIAWAAGKVEFGPGVPDDQVGVPDDSSRRSNGRRPRRVNRPWRGALEDPKR